MSRRAAQVLTAVAFALPLACVAANFTPPRQITIVTDINFPPYLFHGEDGELQGILKDKWELWSRRTGVPVVLEGVEWQKAQQAVLGGERDVIEALSYTEARAARYEFSAPYAPINARVYFHRSISGVNDAASLRGFKVAAKAGSLCGSWLEARGIRDIVPYPDSEALVRAAGRGDVRLFCMDEPAARYFLYRLGLDGEFRESPPLYSTQFHWAVAKGRTALRDFIQDGFAAIPPGQLAAIDDEWLGRSLALPRAVKYLPYVAGAALAWLLVAAALGLLNRALRRRVAARTTELDRALATLQESESRFSAMFDQSPAPLALVSLPDRRFRAVNQAFLDLFGYARAAVIGHTSAEFGGVRAPRERDPLYAALERDGRVDGVNLVSLTAAARQNTTLVSGRRMTLDGAPHVLWSFIDITELRDAQRRIEELNASLEAKVEARTAELKGALLSLKDSQAALLQSEKLAALGRLVAGVAHELNTPIGNSLLSASTLAEQVEDFSGVSAQPALRRSALQAFIARAREATGILTRNLEKAAQLISSFKQVAADQASSQRRSFALREVVDEVLLAHRPMLRKSPIEIRVDVPEGIRLDSYPGPLGQVLGNLITNAVMHGYDGRDAGTVEVSARVDADDRAEIAVIDRGRGIPEADLARIFDPFFTTKLGRGGTGLGLGICHALVTETLGGAISVRSREGEGSAFLVRIPLRAPAAQRLEAA